MKQSSRLRTEIGNYPLCEIDFLTDNIIIFQEQFVSVDTATTKVLINIPQRIERGSRLGPDKRFRKLAILNTFRNVLI
jgi:hypothetical protein